MNFWVSNEALDEMCEGLIKCYEGDDYAAKPVDIEGLAVKFLKIKMYYATFAESEVGRLAFFSDGKVPLAVLKNGKPVNKLFPSNTIILDRVLKRDNEIGRRRFTIAHEVVHYLDDRLQSSQRAASFHTDYDNERVYSISELQKMLQSKEWMANRGAAALLMPKPLLNHALLKYSEGNPIPVYGENVFTPESKSALLRISDFLGVSVTALIIRLKQFRMLEHRPLRDFIVEELLLDSGEASP